MCDSRTVIPRELRSEMLSRLHESHLGCDKCIANAAKCLWWPGINSDMKQKVKNCVQYVQNEPPRTIRAAQAQYPEEEAMGEDRS